MRPGIYRASIVVARQVPDVAPDEIVTLQLRIELKRPSDQRDVAVALASMLQRLTSASERELADVEPRPGRVALDTEGVWLRVTKPDGEQLIEHVNEQLAETLQLQPIAEGIDVRVLEGSDLGVHLIPWDELEQLEDAIRWLRSRRPQ